MNQPALAAENDKAFREYDRQLDIQDDQASQGDVVNTTPDYRTAEFIKDEALVEGLQALDTPDALYELLNESRDLPAWDVKRISNAGRIQDILLRQIETYTQYAESL